MKQNITYKYYKTQHTNTLIIDILKWNKTSHNTYNMILTNNVIQHLGERWRRATTLIIDEVSMLSGDTFDKLEVLARLVRRSGIFFFRFTKSSPQRCFWQVDRQKNAHRLYFFIYFLDLQNLRHNDAFDRWTVGLSFFQLLVWFQHFVWFCRFVWFQYCVWFHHFVWVQRFVWFRHCVWFQRFDWFQIFVGFHHCVWLGLV